MPVLLRRRLGTARAQSGERVNAPASTVTARPWGHTLRGEPVTLYTLRAGPLSAEIMDYGGVIVRLLAPDRSGTREDVVLGHDRLEPYLDRATSPYFGALIGRYGNRIAGGTFTLDGQTYQLARNNGPNALHGGPGGFDQQLWAGYAHAGPAGAVLELTRRSPAGEEGYPGTLDVTVTYTLTPGGTLDLTYAAHTDAPTIVNLTQHTYWNLSGDARRDILGHRLTLNADRFTPVDATLIPTGEQADVAGTPFDLRTPQTLGDALTRHAAHPQLGHAGGYDHNLVLAGGESHSGDLVHAATLHDPQSGRVLDVHTTEPGLQLYTGNFLDGTITGKAGRRYDRHWGLCLETQHFPDSPNRPAFPSTVLRPGERYSSRTRFTFGTAQEEGALTG